MYIYIIMADVCVLCNDPRRSRIEHDIKTGEIHKTVIAEELGVDVMVIWNHMNDHYGQETVGDYYQDHSKMDDETIESVYGKKKVLQDLVMDAKDRMESLKRIDSLTPADTNNLLKTSSILLKAVELLAKLDGELTEERRVTVEMYISLKSAVMMAVQETPGLKEKIIMAVSKAEKKAVKVLNVKIPEELTAES